MPYEKPSTLTRLVNAIQKWAYMPCAQTPLFYLELAAAAAIKAAYTILAPDLREVITKTTGRSAICHATGLVKGARQLTGLPETKTEKYLFPLVGKVDLATWWLFIAGVGEDGLIDFFSGAARLGACQGRPPHSGYGDHMIGGWPGGQNQHVWFTGPQWRTIDWPDTPAAGPQVTVGPGRQGLITGTGKISITGSFPPAWIPFNLRTRWDDDPNGIITESNFEFDPKLLTFQTTIHSEGLNTTTQNRVMVLEVNFPGGVQGISAIASPEGYGYSHG